MGTRTFLSIFLCTLLLSISLIGTNAEDKPANTGMVSPASGEVASGGTAASSYASLNNKSTVTTTPTANDDSRTLPSKESVGFDTTKLDSPLIDILWCGFDKDIILILTEEGTVYHSTDHGKIWKKMRDLFSKTARRDISDDTNVADVDRILQSPNEKDFLIFIGAEGVNWYTDDCGKTVKTINSGRPIKEFQFHPTESKWILASAYTDCDGSDDDDCTVTKELFLSQDLGQTWKFLADYVIQFSWGVQDYSFLMNIPKERIIISHDIQKEGHQKNKGWSENTEIAMSDDFFKTKKTIVDRGNKFLLSSSYFFCVQVDDEDKQDVRLLVGNPRYSNYKLEYVQLPSKKGQSNKGKMLEHSYTILDSTEGQVFLHVNHYGAASKYGNIYISDSTGVRYSASLRNHVRSSDGQCDFEKVSGLEGIYMSNVYANEQVRKQKGESNVDEITVEREGNKPKGTSSSYKANQVEGKGSSRRTLELDNYKQTRISFDKGAIWNPLRAPKYNSTGHETDCDAEDECGLHLHSYSNNNYGPFYSTDNSLGIVLGTGNIGKYLSNREDEVNTYLSRDGGLTWFEIKRGSHIYEIGDHGALIVVASDQEATKHVFYTWNEGQTWDRVQISEVPIQIENIIIEPSNTAEKFIVYGRHGKNQEGIVIALDFSTLHERECQYPDKPNDASSDYETWSPNGPISEHCLMGHQTTYVRRKREAQCYNKEMFDRWYSYQNCECTEEDWECDLGYERKKSGPCEPSNGTEQINKYAPPEVCDDYYTISTGYRKVAGNTCRGGVDHQGFKLPCPGKILSRQNVFVLFILLSVAAGIWVLSKQGGYSLDKLTALVPDFFNKKSALIQRNQYERPKQDEIPDQDDDEEFSNRIAFDDQENLGSATILEDRNDQEQQGRRMTGRGGLETASRTIPTLSGPGSKSHDDEDDDDIRGFDPRS